MLGRHLDQLPEWALGNAVQAGHAMWPILEAHLQEQGMASGRDRGSVEDDLLYRASIALDSVASALL